MLLVKPSHALMFSTQILKRDKKSQEKAPKIMLDELNATAPKGSRQFSTSARRVQEDSKTFEEGQNNRLWPGENRDEPSYHELEHGQNNLLEHGENRDGPSVELELPSLPLPSHAVLKYRYNPIIKQFTNLMMRDGKLSKAQRVRPSVSLILDLNWYCFDANCIGGLEHCSDTPSPTNGAASENQP